MKAIVVVLEDEIAEQICTESQKGGLSAQEYMRAAVQLALADPEGVQEEVEKYYEKRLDRRSERT